MPKEPILWNFGLRSHCPHHSRILQEPCYDETSLRDSLRVWSITTSDLRSVDLCSWQRSSTIDRESSFHSQIWTTTGHSSSSFNSYSIWIRKSFSRLASERFTALNFSNRRREEASSSNRPSIIHRSNFCLQRRRESLRHNCQESTDHIRDQEDTKLRKAPIRRKEPIKIGFKDKRLFNMESTWGCSTFNTRSSFLHWKRASLHHWSTRQTNSCPYRRLSKQD